jgi:hypothetical protein
MNELLKVFVRFAWATLAVLETWTWWNHQLAVVVGLVFGALEGVMIVMDIRCAMAERALARARLRFLKAWAWSLCLRPVASFDYGETDPFLDTGCTCDDCPGHADNAREATRSRRAAIARDILN